MRKLDLFKKVISEKNIDLAYKSICKNRKYHKADADIWEFKRSWHRNKKGIISKLLNGNYRFDAVKQLKTKKGLVYVFIPQDALVLKAISQILIPLLTSKLKNVCHLKGQGGVRGAHKFVQKHIQDNKFVYKTDVKDFYQSINHKIL